MNELPLTLAITEYDHVSDLTNGRVVPEGIRLNCLNLPLEELFFRFIVHREWDVSEMSMAKYVSMLANDDRSLTAIPVFPSRMFRHSSIYIRRDGPVKTPADLVGRKVGLPEWAQTASVYSRGFLRHQYGLDLGSIQWVQAGVNEPGRTEKVALNLPEGISLTRRPESSLNEMLLSGEIDAALTAHPPHSFEEGDARVARMFEDFLDIEADYFRQTGIFPIMHIIAIRREVADAHPWIARNLLTAFEEAKRRSIERALDIKAPRFPIPWCYEHAHRAQLTFGKNYWPYGIEDNRRTLDAFLQFAFEQGVCRRRVAIEEMFPKQLQTSSRV